MEYTCKILNKRTLTLCKWTAILLGYTHKIVKNVEENCLYFAQQCLVRTLLIQFCIIPQTVTVSIQYLSTKPSTNIRGS